MKWLSGIITVGAFGLLYYFEKKSPLRRQIEPKLVNASRDLAIAAATGIVVNFLEKPVAKKLASIAEKNRFGLLKLFRLPRAVDTVLGIVLLDYTLYLWHVLTHKSPFLWRFHKIHHADLDLTAATAIRFHFGEMTISILFRAGQVLLLGVSPRSYELWQNFLLLNVLFHHSNVKLPENFEKKLQYLITTPRLHGIHHSIKESEMNSNWSSGLAAWDYLHGTFRDDVPQDEIIIGIEGYKTPEDVNFTKMLTEPFTEITDRRAELPETAGNP